MTTYPLEYYLCLKGTPHIKIVDPNRWEWTEDPDNERFYSLCYVRDHFVTCVVALELKDREETRYREMFDVEGPYHYFGYKVQLTNPEERPVAVQDSDDHLLLVLRFGERDWIELGEDEALAMMHGELES